MNRWHSVCKILILINSREKSISGDCGCLRVYSASKNLLAVLDPWDAPLELSNPHWCGCVIKPSLLESPLRTVRADVLGRGRCAKIPNAELVLVYSSSARACDLPVFKVQLGPKHSTQTLPWFSLSYRAAGCREGTQTCQLRQLLCVQQCLCSAVCLCLSQICSSVVNGILFFLMKPSSPPKLKSYLNSCRQLSMCHLHTLPLLLIRWDARSNKPLIFLFQITPAKIVIIQNTVFL